MEKQIHVLRSDVITNIFYGITGWSCWAAGMPIIIWLSLILLMLGSGIHHAIYNRKTAYLDWIPIYMVFLGLAATLLFEQELATHLWVISVISAGIFDKHTDGQKRYSIMAVIAVILLVSIAVKLGEQVLLRVAYLYSLAFIPWKLGEDINKHGSGRYALYHGFWHIITAYAIWETASLVVGA